mgnify:CR=1 FL=1
MAKIRTVADIPRPKIQEFEAKPEYKQRWMVVNILLMSFIMTCVAFLVIIILGVMPRPDEATPP